MTTENRLRELTNRLRERARSLPAGEVVEPDLASPVSPAADPAPNTKPAREAPPPRHWQEVAEDRDDPEPAAPARTALSLEMGDVATRATASERLRALFADGAWHSALELVEAGGLRYGARLLELRRGLDGGGPLDIEVERRPRAGRFVWFYRAAPLGARLPLP